MAAILSEAAVELVVCWEAATDPKRTVKKSHDLECNASISQVGIWLGGNDNFEQKEYSMALVAIYRSYLCYWLRKDVRTLSQGFGRLFESVRPANRRSDSGPRHDLLAQEYVLLECLGMAGSSCLRNPLSVTRSRVRDLFGRDRSLRSSSTSTFFFSFLDTCDQRVISVLIPLIGSVDYRPAVNSSCRPA
jgi:hypothetical protein